MKATTLPRAALVAVGCCLLLGLAAFWPSRPWVTPSRPALKPPIVFDELVNMPPPSADPARAPRAP